MPISGGNKALQWSGVKKTGPFTIAGGSAVVIPNGRMLIAAQGDDAFAPSVQIQLFHDVNGWTPIERYEDGNNLSLVNGTWVFIPWGFRYEGADFRLYNTGGPNATNIIYAYVELE